MIDLMLSSLISLYIKSKKLPKWETMDIETTNLCNLRCIMCPYEKIKRKKEKMDIELYKKIIKDAVSFGIKKVTLTNYGEPLLDDLIFERIQYAKKYGMDVGFFTNGTLLNINIINRLIESEPDWIYFSFDGASKETYERIRKGANFESVKNNIVNFCLFRKKLGKSKPKIIVGLTLQKENSREIKDFYRIWKNLADIIVISRVDNRKDKNNFSGGIFPCLRLLTRVVVLVDGRVALCCKDFNGDVILGDLRYQSLKDIWEQSKEIRMLHLKRKGHLIPICAGCDDIRKPGVWLSKMFGHLYTLIRPFGERIYYFLKKEDYY